MDLVRHLPDLMCNGLVVLGMRAQKSLMETRRVEGLFK